jgi:predicted acetyltransferase/quinol monooxygenase YgiN
MMDARGHADAFEREPAVMRLVWPAAEYLAGYMAALASGWSPDNTRAEAAAEQLLEIARDGAAFLHQQVDRDASGPPIVLPDGSTVNRLPSVSMWMWDGEFCGLVGFRWQPGTVELPPTCLGHIGYAVVPSKRRRGYATEALRQFLPQAAREGLPYVELTTDVDNIASQRVITSNGGVLHERFTKHAAYGGADGLRFRIALAVPVDRTSPSPPQRSEQRSSEMTSGNSNDMQEGEATMPGNEHVSWMFELAIKQGREADFRALAAEMAQATFANELGTLDYEWYVSDDGRALHLFERYESVDAALIHMGTFSDRYMQRFFEVLTPTRITLYGVPDARVRAGMADLAPEVLARAAGFSR